MLVRFETWVLEAIQAHGGKATIVAVAKYIWKHYRKDLESSEAVFYTWQYRMRWAATSLRKKGKLMPASQSRRGVWEVVD